jgi:uncharacterized protein YndB with AHSA1/START domain/DNA-binding transcriptional ArsR family regulator
MAAYPAMDEVFKALADPSRRRLLDSLNARNGQTLRELCAELDMARQSVSKHLDILEAANLVTTVKRGREKLHYLNGDPINEIGERWINRYERPRVEALADLKRALEAPMDKPTFVYTSYIRTTPERLWQALTEPAFTRRYWGLTFETDWQPGSAMTWNQFGITNADPEQVVLEADPYTRLSYTWHTMTPELMERVGGVDADTIRELGTEPRSQVTFSLEPQGDMVKLTVIHDGLGELTHSMISQGWPSVLSNLKTLLETGEPLPDPRLAERAGATA